MKLQTWQWIAAVGSIAATGYILFRKKAGDSLAKTAGKAVAEGAVDLGVGIAEGFGEAVGGVVDVAFGVKDFTFEAIEGRMLSDVNTNIHKIQGRIYQPEGDGSGHYTLEVQNTGQNNQAMVKIQLVTDKWGLDPVWEDVGIVDIPAGTGVLAKGTIVMRDGPFGTFPVTARLYANGHLLDKTQ